jgi:N-acyl-D-aspartate/D-glutamate deacylase
MDYIIRNASIIDGTGRPGFIGDVAIKDGLIAAVGGHVSDDVANIIDATGCIATPGFIDVHTHYDGQVTWDDAIEPSSSHGVTTLILGNCGVGFAPMRAGDRDRLVDLMEGIEDIPGTALFEGVPWGEWETFPEYMDFLGQRSYALDIGAQVPHGALRFYVMGERGVRNEPATEEDVRLMASITFDAMTAGALGFSSSRTVIHRSLREDLPTPGTFADENELWALMDAVARSGRGVVEIIPSGVAGKGRGVLDESSDPVAEAELYADLSRRTGVPVTFITLQSPGAPHYWREVLNYVTTANREGARLNPQVSFRAITLLHGLGSYHLFMHRPTYRKIAHLSLPDRVAEMRKKDVKHAILAEADGPGQVHDQFLVTLFRRGLIEPFLYPMGSPVDYEPAPETSIAARIRSTGADPEGLLYDTLLENDGKSYCMALLANYVDGNLDAAREMLLHPSAVVGLGDAGAHVTYVCDASNTTFALSHWGVQRTRGARIPIETIVQKLTSVSADLYGLADRGRIECGLRADLNVIDLERLSVMPPYVVHDLPAGGSRLLQEAKGYVATFVAGEITRRDGIDTGRRPGRLVRSAPNEGH